MFYLCFISITSNIVAFIRNNVATTNVNYNRNNFQCQSAALDELFGNPAECFQRYHTAQILLHSLSQHVSHSHDRALLIKCEFSLKRLFEMLSTYLLFKDKTFLARFIKSRSSVTVAMNEKSSAFYFNRIIFSYCVMIMRYTVF